MPDFNPFNQKSLPDMSDADWKRLEQERRRTWERENKEFLRDYWQKREEEWGVTMEEMRHQRMYQMRHASMSLLKIAKDLLAMEFPSDKALNDYLRNHPGANKADHTVKQQYTQYDDDRSLGTYRRHGSVRPSSLDGMSKRKAVTLINSVLRRHTNGFFTDDYWKPVSDIWKDLEKEGINAYLISTEYYKNEDGNPAGKIWKFYVEFKNDAGRDVQVYGIIQASGAGLVKDPLSRYDLVAYVS